MEETAEAATGIRRVGRSVLRPEKDARLRTASPASGSERRGRGQRGSGPEPFAGCAVRAPGTGGGRGGRRDTAGGGDDCARRRHI